MQVKTSLAFAALASCALAQGSTPDLTTLLSNTSILSNLTSFLQLFPDTLSQLAQATNITILAPSNDAFAKFLNTSAGQMVAQDQQLLAPILTYHVLNGTYSSQTISDTPAFIPTLLSDPAYANVTGGQVVEAVLNDGAATFFSGLKASSTADPNLLDVAFTGGLVHVIDTVLTVPMNISTTAVAANLTAAAGALTQANLVPTLEGLSDVTVFVPDNEAFANIASALPTLSIEQLTSILTYHVISGTVGYSSLLGNLSLPTVQGNNVTITVSDAGVFVNSAKVVLPDVLVANGVVHVIDNVLNPNNTAPANSTESGSPAYPGASSASGVPFTSGVPTPTSTIAAATSAAGGGGADATSSLSQAGAQPIQTAAMGAAALFGAGAVLMNL